MPAPQTFWLRPGRLIPTLVLALGAGGVRSAPAREHEHEALRPPPANLHFSDRHALREFDRFLDHHPLVEDQLRLDPALIDHRSYLAANPDLAGLLTSIPDIRAGLRVYPRYYLNRALIQQANAPVSFAALAPFRDLFAAQPALEREFAANPAIIRDPAYRAAHPRLVEFLHQHPALDRLYFPIKNPFNP